MKAFLVGGAVRDRLLGLPQGDRDWVVVGSTPEAMVRAGFRPVGKDFPVFLHPETREEYALARTERKTAPGYRGFVFSARPDVTLEEDLQRRDLTINAIAEDEHGGLIDPYGGQTDLSRQIFRHVSPAFAEDPVRILRVARFAARFGDFTVAPETLALMRKMVDDGEVDHLVAERVWQELARGLMYGAPARMIRLLHDCGALARVLPEAEALFERPDGAQTLAALDRCARLGRTLEVRWACLLCGCDALRQRPDPKAADELPGLVRAASERLRAPVACRELAELLARHGLRLHHAPLDADTLLQVLTDCDALRRSERFGQLLAAISALDPRLGEGRLSLLHDAARVAAAVDAGAVARACARPSDIADAVQAARRDALARIVRPDHA